MAEKEEGREFELDFGVGKLKFGGLFRGIGGLIDLASKLGEEAGEVRKTGEIGGLPKNARGVYGFSIRTMAGGRPVVETFGNIKDSPRGPVVEEVREPIVDVFDEEGHVLAIVELPGVEETDISIEVEGDILKLSATGRTARYAREVLLPARVDSQSVKTSYKNGILEVRLPKDQNAGK